MHWRKLTNQNYLGSYSLEENGEYKNKVVTITKVEKLPVQGADGKAEDCVVASLQDEKPFILNKTNLKTIEAVAGTPDVDKWAGLRIELTVKKVRAFGETTDALRIVPKAPALPVLDADHPSFEAIKKVVKDGTYTIGAVKKKYAISAETEKLLQS
jgi:hypothetical protein